MYQSIELDQISSKNRISIDELTKKSERNLKNDKNEVPERQAADAEFSGRSVGRSVVTDEA